MHEKGIIFSWDNLEHGFIDNGGNFIGRDDAQKLVGQSNAENIGGPFDISRVPLKTPVVSAIRKNKPVPPEVLKNYLALAAKPQPPDAKIARTEKAAPQKEKSQSEMMSEPEPAGSQAITSPNQRVVTKIAPDGSGIKKNIRGSAMKLAKAVLATCEALWGALFRLVN
jgi:hypothetical protein